MATLRPRANRCGAPPQRVTSTRATEIFFNLCPELPLRLVSDTAALRERVEMRPKAGKRVLLG